MAGFKMSGLGNEVAGFRVLSLGFWGFGAFMETELYTLSLTAPLSHQVLPGECSNFSGCRISGM